MTAADTPIIRNHNELFDALASTAVDGIIVIDEKGIVLFYNNACQKLFQYTQKEVLGQSVNMLMPEPYRTEHDGYIARYRKTHEAHIIGIGREVRGRRKDGSVFPMYLSVGEGAIEKRKVFVGIVHDLTALHAEEERRKTSDRRLAQIVDSSDEVIISMTLDGIITTWNLAAERTFGYTPEEMVGHPIACLIPEDRLSEEQDILRRIRSGESILHYETVRRRKDGREIIMTLSASPVRDGTGTIVGASKISRDVTKQRKAEAQTIKLESELAHVSRVSAIGQLSSALAHELNQPLTAIMNYVSAAKLRWKPTGDPNDERGPQLLDRAIEQVERAGAIIQRLRAFLEKREPQRMQENINDLLQEAVALGFVGSHDDNMKFRLDLADGLPAADVDRVQIEQVIVNLVRNATEAMKSSPRRELTISSYRTGPKLIEIAIADTGPGIPDHIAAQLFEPFVTTKETGMGVGLSISRTIVEAHGGQIWMTPNPEGGTIFKIQLPVSS